MGFLGIGPSGAGLDDKWPHQRGAPRRKLFQHSEASALGIRKFWISGRPPDIALMSESGLEPCFPRCPDPLGVGGQQAVSLEGKSRPEVRRRGGEEVVAGLGLAELGVGREAVQPALFVVAEPAFAVPSGSGPASRPRRKAPVPPRLAEFRGARICPKLQAWGNVRS